MGERPAATRPADPNAPRWPGAVPSHGRFGYRPIHRRPDWTWPGGARLAVYIGFNVEHFAFGDGLGATLGPASPQPDVLNHSWREYGNRVGAWRCLELFDALGLSTGALVNTALVHHAPELVAALAARGDELVAHGHTNAERQGTWSARDEAAMLAACRETLGHHGGQGARGWLSPWISESPRTPDLLAEAGYEYTLNWCHDDQPVPMRTRGGRTLWSIPYPQELNDIPMIVARQMEAPAFFAMVADQFEVMLEQSARQPLVMGLALHPYIVGQPHRLKHLRRCLEALARARDQGGIWWTTPGAVCSFMQSAFGQRLEAFS